MVYRENEKTVLAGYWKSSKSLASSKRHIFRYLVIREGVRNDVYRDKKGILTVGIGHRVVPGDGLNYGDLISNQQIIDFFDFDYKRLKIELYTNVSWYEIPNKVAVASFLWTHGLGDFVGRETHILLQNQYTGVAELQAWVKKNWDLFSPVNISRNQADFQLWQVFTSPGAGIFHQSLHSSGDFYFSRSMQESFFDVKDLKGFTGNPVAGSAISGGARAGSAGVGGVVALLAAGLGFLFFRK